MHVAIFLGLFQIPGLCGFNINGGSRGGGGGWGSGPPLLGHDVGFLTLGPKLDPPFFACL